MNANSTLEVTLRDILRVIYPSTEDRRIRDQIIDELRAVVRSVESLRGATVEPFGSFVSNLFTRWGDLDLSIQVASGSSVRKKSKQNLLGDILAALGRRAGWHNLQFIANARVPILVCNSSHLNISCDISINNLSGQIKSKLFLWINEIDGRFRDMVLLVKEWAKAHGINDSKSGTFNSYTLSLLIIFHFQTCEPAILPPLKEIYPGNVFDELNGVMRAVTMRQIEETCAQNIARFRLSRRRNESKLSELFILFLAKFSGFSSWAPLYGVCPYTGRWERIASNFSWLSKNYALYVEDPFEQPFNSARTVHREKLSSISEKFETTHRVLCSSNQNQRSLVANLVRPQVAQLLATPLNNHGGYTRTRSQIHRAVQSPSQAQNRFLNRRVDRHPNNMTVNRNVNSSHSRGDQLWRHV